MHFGKEGKNLHKISMGWAQKEGSAEGATQDPSHRDRLAPCKRTSKLLSSAAGLKQGGRREPPRWGVISLFKKQRECRARLCHL